MIRTYTYKIKPNNKLHQKFVEWSGVCRLIYNLAISSREEAFKKGVRKNYYDLAKELTELKQDNEWMYEVSAQTQQAMLEQLEEGYKKFFTDLKRGVKASKPKYMSKKRQKSIPFKSTKTTHNAFKLPKFGIVKVFKFKPPKGELKTARIIKEVDGLYLKVVVKKEPKETVRENQSAVALDMGVRYFLTTSYGEFVENPKHLFKRLKELRVQRRKLSRMKKFGSNWNKQVKVIQKLHLKVRRSRMDFLHKESTKLSKEYGNVIVEDLNIKGMSKNTKLSKHILDCGWGIFFELLNYKTNLIKVDAKYTSQTCSSCGHVSKENRKTQSHFECVECGYIENADKNASNNIFQRGQTLMEANVNH